MDYHYRSQNILQKSSNKNNMVLAQKQTYGQMEPKPNTQLQAHITLAI